MHMLGGGGNEPHGSDTCLLEESVIDLKEHIGHTHLELWVEAECKTFDLSPSTNLTKQTSRHCSAKLTALNQHIEGMFHTRRCRCRVQAFKVCRSIQYRFTQMISLFV